MAKLEKEIDKLLKQVEELKNQMGTETNKLPDLNKATEELIEFIADNDFHFELGKKDGEMFVNTNMNGVIFGHFLSIVLRNMKEKDNFKYTTFILGLQTILTSLDEN